jgi:hypothetical protein
MTGQKGNGVNLYEASICPENQLAPLNDLVYDFQYDHFGN